MSQTGSAPCDREGDRSRVSHLFTVELCKGRRGQAPRWNLKSTQLRWWRNYSRRGGEGVPLATPEVFDHASPRATSRQTSQTLVRPRASLVGSYDALGSPESAIVLHINFVS